MTLTKKKSSRVARRVQHALRLVALLMTAIAGAPAQGVSTTTVQGTVYLANGQTGTGTLVVKWPAFTTAGGQAIAADSLTTTITADGFVSVNLAPNQGSTPAGLYYTAVYYMSDGSTSTEYWVVPAATQATLGQVRTQVMPAAQAVQAVTKTYVDEKVSELTQSLLTASGGNLNGPLYLNGDPSQALQAADKHYVDSQVATALPLAGGTMTGVLNVNADPTQEMQAASKHYVDTAAANAWPGMVLRADQFAGADFGAKLQACVNAVDATYGGTCDARNFAGNLVMAANLTIATGNTAVLLPCATIATASQVVVAAGTRNVALRGCALRGGSQASGSAGGTVFAYSGAGATVQVGDSTYAADTPGFHMDNVVINTTAAANATAQGLAAYRTQDLDLDSLYLLGNANQTGMTLDGTGNYTGGTFLDVQVSGYQTAVNAIGHQLANPATTDWVNASTFVRLHIDCPTASGSPIAGTYGINLQQGDGNTFAGGDVEGCATALHLGPNAQNNTIVGLRNENSTKQVQADTGSAYNNWIAGGTMFTGQLADNGTRNSFLDTFHRSFNALNGDWYGSQQDATLINHYRLGTGAGNERGLQDRYQTDFGYRWTTGLSDATGGEQYYQILDELNNVNRISVGQYNNGQSSTNNQTVINAAGTGAVVLNGSNNAGTGGVAIGSGGPSSSTVATISNAGNAQFNGALQVGGTAQSTGTLTVRNNADAEVDYYLWPGLTASQKGAFTYKDFNGNSQWYMVKDQSNNWALNSAVGGLDSFKAYQSTNSGDTYIDASNATGAVRVNYETGAGSSFKIYGGNSSTLYASFTATNSIAFPGLAAASGRNCLQIDSSGYITNTGAACGSGGSGTVGTGSTGQIAYYTANGASIGGTSTVPLTAGGTGATNIADALVNLGALPASQLTSGAGDSRTAATDAASVAQARLLAGHVCAEDYLWEDTAYGGTDIGTAFTAAIQQNPPTSLSQVSLCHRGTYTAYTPILIDRQTDLDGNGSKIVYDLPAGAQVTVSNATLTAGSNIVTVSAGLPSGLAAGMRIGGAGTGPGNYVLCVYPNGACSGLTANQFEIARAAAYTTAGIVTTGNANVTYLRNTKGLATGQTFTWQGQTTPVAISSVSGLGSSTHYLTLASAPTTQGNNPTVLTMAAGNTISSTLYAVQATPLIMAVRNGNASANEDGYNEGLSIHGLTIADPQAYNFDANNQFPLFPSVPGEEGILVSGWDWFKIDNVRFDGIGGAIVTLGGPDQVVPSSTYGYAAHIASWNTDFPAREGFVENISARNCGDWKTHQACIEIATPAQATLMTDEDNGITLGAGNIDYPSAEGIWIGSYHAADFQSVGPRFVYSTPSLHVEGGNGARGQAGSPHPFDLVNITEGSDVHFSGAQFIAPGQARYIVDCGACGATISVTGGTMNVYGNPVTYTVQFTNGSSTVAYVSGGAGKFDPSGVWDDQGAITEDGASCTSASPCTSWLAPSGSVAANGLSLQLAGPWTGATTSTGTLMMGWGGGDVIQEGNNGSNGGAEELQILGNGYYGDLGANLGALLIGFAAKSPPTTPGYFTSGGDTDINGWRSLVYPNMNIQAGVNLNGITQVRGGTNTVYRCTTAGTLPVGALTTVAANCGASVSTPFQLP